MQRLQQTNPSQIFLHSILALAMLFLGKIGDSHEPFSLALAYAMPFAGLSPVWSFFSYFLVSISSGNLTCIFISAAQAVLLCATFLLTEKCNVNKLGKEFLSFFSLTIALALFVIFAPFTAYTLPFVFAQKLGATSQKVLISAAIFLLSAIFSVALKALLGKFLRCRLKGEEVVFCLLGFVLIGVGICRFMGVNAYLGVAFFILLVFSCVTKDTLSLVCAFVLSLPTYLVFHLSIERFFVYGIVIALFMQSGRLAAACGLLAVFFAYGYADGLYAYPTAALVQAILSATLPALLFVLLPTPLLRSMENKLIFYREKHISRIAINRNRAAIGKQLYELSALFREVESTFAALGTTEAEDGAKEYIRIGVIEETCKDCPNKRACMQKKSLDELPKLIEIGCVKGKVNLIDVPNRLAETCVSQSDLLYAVNRRIGEYQKYMTEAENAAAGRSLLARQAQGVSEILRNLALEQSEPLHISTQMERDLNIALLRAGIVCSELLVFGEQDDVTLSLITFGQADVKKIAAIATHILQKDMMISEKIVLSGDKFCCILRQKPYFDAAFGVATTKKSGEIASGDTHSVLKIDERKFLVALSDGMGSGEYAKRISESTISLLESFYRAKMPPDTVLSTINKLLTFSKEETFACVDIAVVDLNDGRADIVKIGSPFAFILSGNTVKVLESHSLPLGILDSLRPDASTYHLQENDTLLFVSDGITGAFGSTGDLYEVLKKIPLHNPQQLADLLLQEALRAYGGVAKDDMTAVAVRIFKNAV